MTPSPPSILRTLPIAIDVLIIFTPSRSLLARSFLPFIHVCIAIDTFYVWIHPWPWFNHLRKFCNLLFLKLLTSRGIPFKNINIYPFTQPKQSGANRQCCQSSILHIMSSIAIALFSPRLLGRILNAWEAATPSPFTPLLHSLHETTGTFFFLLPSLNGIWCTREECSTSFDICKSRFFALISPLYQYCEGSILGGYIGYNTYT